MYTHIVYTYDVYADVDIFFPRHLIQVTRGTSRPQALGLQCDAGRGRVCLKVVGGFGSHWKSLGSSFLLGVDIFFSSEVA